MAVDAVQGLSSPAGIAERYDSSIVVRRWGATWIDFLVLIGLVAACFALPDTIQGACVVAASLAVVAYFPMLEHVFGRTLGKLVCRVRVVNAAGGRPSWAQTIVRTLLRLLEVNPVLLGGVPAGLFVLSSRKRQRLGDMAADTFVLREEDAVTLDRLRVYSSAPGAGRAGVLPRPSTAPPPLPPRLPPPPPARTNATSWLAPTNRSGWAIAAGYLGLFAVLMLPAPFALAAGILGLREIGRTPGLGGKGRAIFGIAMGGLFSALLFVVLFVSLLGRR